jgi:uncharacterized protein (DUF697 family)
MERTMTEAERRLPPQGSGETGSQETPMMPEEAAASLRVLVFFAGFESLKEEEKAVLHDAAARFGLPGNITVESLLSENIVLKAEMERITSLEARERTYNAVYCLAHTEGACPAEKQQLLETIRDGLHISPEKATLLGRIYTEASAWLVPGHLNPIADAEARTKAVHDYMLRFSIVSAVFGAFPVPVFSVLTDLFIISIQVKMVRDIGQLWGHKVDREAARSILGSIVGATGLRIAVHTVLNVVPILGSAVGAATAFGSTWALGKVANEYFAANGKLDAAALKKLYAEAREEAKHVYEKSKHLIAERLHNGKDSHGGGQAGQPPSQS